MDNIITEMDKYTNYARGDIEYPYLVLSKSYDELAVTLSSIPRGDLNLGCLVDDKLSFLKGGVKKDPLVIKRLVDICPLVLVINKDKCKMINKIKDLIEEGEFSWT